MAKATITQALTEIFGSDVRTSGELNLIDVVRHYSKDDGYGAEQIAAAQAIADEYGWALTVTRRERWLSLEGEIIRRPLTQDAIDAMGR